MLVNNKNMGMENSELAQDKKAKTLLKITRILASILALFFLLAFGPKFFDGIADIYRGEEGWEGIVMMLTFLVFIVGFVLSWWKKCTGGLLIFFASIIQMAPFLIIEGNLGSLIFGIPLLVVGVLFLVVCKQKSV